MEKLSLNLFFIQVYFISKCKQGRIEGGQVRAPAPSPYTNMHILLCCFIIV